ncbi:MAG: FadR/GntR family transcriptional regulator [Terriglobales bacterium]
MSVPIPAPTIETEAAPRTGFEAIPRNKVYQAVAKQLERHIAEHLKPGDRLPPERQLVQMLCVSRGSVRDAIRSLELMGLLEPRQGFGTVVCDRATGRANSLANALLEKRKMIADLLDVRKMLEPPIAGCAAAHASPEQICDLQNILIRQAASVGRGELGIDEDSEFHYNIALFSNNSVVIKVVDVLMDLLRETRERSLQGERRQQESMAGHRRILSALRRGDAAGAEKAMRRHIEEIENIVLKKI